MKAIILAAGQGTRLKKYTENLPKGMLEFDGKTIIERQIELYKECGIEEIIVVKGYAANMINYDGVTYYTNHDYENTNMVESLMAAKESFDSDMIVSYSDILFEKDMLLSMMNRDEAFAVAVDDEWKTYWFKRYGKVDYDTESLVIDNDNNIVELGKENPPIDEISARYIGLLKFSEKGLKKIIHIMNEAYVEYANGAWQQSGKPVKKAYMTDLLNAIIESNEQVKSIRFKHGWIEFDTNEDYENAIEWIKDGSIVNIINL